LLDPTNTTVAMGFGLAVAVPLILMVQVPSPETQSAFVVHCLVVKMLQAEFGAALQIGRPEKHCTA
jgi:hypothetical protein